jgi:hypothetical protein
MLGYRTAKPHHPAECPLCALRSPGHQLCQNGPASTDVVATNSQTAAPSRTACTQLATTQFLRHATDAEYDALPENFKPIDGRASQVIFACDDCTDLVEPFCDHTPQPPPPCPTCKAAMPDPCLKQSGQPRSGPHAGRITQPQSQSCQHWHQADCDPFTNCSCSQDDIPPQRSPRIVAPPPPPGPAPMLLPVHGPMLKVLTDHGIDVDRIVSTTLVPSPDGSNIVTLTVEMVVRQANGDLAYDTHGKPRTETAEIPLVIPRPTDPVTDMPPMIAM